LPILILLPCLIEGQIGPRDFCYGQTNDKPVLFYDFDLIIMQPVVGILGV